jgi:biotin synthase
MACIRPSIVASRLQRAAVVQIPSRCLSSVRDVPITASTMPYQVATPTKSALRDALRATAPRNTWTKEEISEIYNTPLFELHYAAVG